MEFNIEVISPFNGTVEGIMFSQGDIVEEGEAVITISVDGYNMDILSQVKGYIVIIDVNLGEKVLSGMVIAIIREIN